MTTQPSKQLETIPNTYPDREYEVDLTHPEFTCLCPKTGQPDFATFPDRVRAGATVRRAEIAEALSVVLPRRRALPRGRDQHGAR